jgi:hypothetical protein
MDITFWQEVVKKECKLPDGYTVVQLTPDLLGFLGSTDIEVRDPIGYTVLAYWMVRDGHYTPDDLRAMRDQLITNLSIGIGEKDTDSVFLRSFSILMLSLIVYRDNQVDFLSVDEINALLDKSLWYFEAEQDLRGYVPEKGWAHTCAHTADAFKFLARNIKTDVDDHARILNAIADKLLLAVTYVHVHSEDERLVSVLVDILKRGLVELAVWEGWLERFASWKRDWPKDGDFKMTIHAPWLNVKNFLRSLYFRLEWTGDLPAPAAELKPKVLDVLKAYGQ